ncbi:restriction endonuclease subunit S [[Clostridium] spiroforme]|nr:restriction endonuclease subunit S [Thomasclavelia spiroformis]
MKFEIKQRIEQIKKGEVPQDYKKTKIGIIPSEWKIDKLQNISIKLTEKVGDQKLETLSITAGKGFVNQAKKFGKELSGKQYINYTVIYREDFSYNKGNSKKYPQGCIYMLEDREKAAVPNVFNSFRFNAQCIYYYKQLFLYGFLNRQLSRYINSGVRNDGLLNLYDEDFYSCILPVPLLREQKRIADILSIQDKIIELKEKMIVEKQKQKKYLMQTLLTGKIRLYDFTDKWQNIKIENLGSVYSGGTPSTKKDIYWNNGNIRWIQSGLIQNSFIKADSITKYITEIGLKNSSAKIIKPYSVLVAITGATCANVGYIDFEATANQSVISITPKDSIALFVYYLLMYNRNNILKLQGGSAQGGVTLNDIKKFTLFMSDDIEEQTAIANVISTADKEIELLKKELEQEKQKKKALMQLLLTGIVRV